MPPARDPGLSSPLNSTIQDEFNRLPDSVRWALERADGYMDLKMWSHARAELEVVDERLRDCAPCTQMCLRLNMEQKAWRTAADLAHQLCERIPDEPMFWVQHAYATRRCEDIGAARAILEEALHRFPQEVVIRYNLACYACLHGRMAVATEMLREVFQLDKTFRALAREDQDLEPLWGVFDEDE